MKYIRRLYGGWLGWPYLSFLLYPVILLTKSSILRTNYESEEWKCFGYGQFGCLFISLQLYSGFPDAKSVVVYIINVLLYGEEAYAWPLWFLYAQAIFFLIESFLPNRQRLRAFVHIIYICALAASSLYLLHSDLFPKLFTYTPQCAFGGCGFILCGYYLKKYEANIKINRYIFAALLLCLSYVLRVLTMPLWELTGGLALIIIAL